MSSLKKYYYHEEWNIGIIQTDKKDIACLDDIANLCQDNHIYWLDKKYHFQADPFIVENDDILYIFYEALNHWWTKGHIRCRILNKHNNTYREIEDFAIDDINQLNCHLSFPFIWQEDGQYYMMPESHENNEVCLFQATDFPKHWQQIANPISDKKYVDNILIKHDGRYYLIGSEHKTNNRIIYYADELTDHWQPLTEANFQIQITDAHQRLGGGTFNLPKTNQQMRSSDFYLPCQENATEYGKSLLLKQLTLDTHTQHWQESTLTQLYSQSNRYPDGMHTLNFSKNYMVIDAKRWVFQPFNFFVRKYRQIASILQK
ncbi:glucosamine inositolphosphorylceramide transferase family protein [Psychrobacter sp. I-STPA10]|uniref:glucosamine inositolphosphorylceramide transferase family protein n=1 Tax=Psychrobacter sp. I-STPA10 TaxID=2585769 RepID=UPI001E2B6321|nr:hypothetical protein [Psychrobacter sp. I-STPA10]